MNVAIIGGGPAGLLCLAHLAKLHEEGPLNVHLIEKNITSPSTPPFSSINDFYVLNVPAGKMSWDENDPDAFLKWLRENGVDAKAGEFVSRRYFGEFINTVLKNCLLQQTNDFKITEHNIKAADISMHGNHYSVTFADGNVLRNIDSVILATGNYPPRAPFSADTNFLRSEKWFGDTLGLNEMGIEKKSDVLIFGSGLTAVDILLLLQNKNHEGKITVMSPHGWLPLPHQTRGTYRDFSKEFLHLKTAREIFSVVKRHIRAADDGGYSWQDVIDSFRNHMQAFWMSLPLAEKEVFFRHLRHLWGVARHRIPLEVEQRINEIKSSNKFFLLAGRSSLIVQDENGKFRVDYMAKGSLQKKSLFADYLFNCTGPEMDVTRLNSLLYQNLLKKGMIVPGQLMLGVRANENGEIYNNENKVLSGLYTLGSNLRGVLWETTAVPEMRKQAEKIAKKILEGNLNLQT